MIKKKFSTSSQNEIWQFSKRLFLSFVNIKKRKKKVIFPNIKYIQKFIKYPQICAPPIQTSVKSL